ncbi:MAG: aminodeoxychorismate/anthranilate synthase component II [Flavobacteriales bacterium]|nr:aminodeoxychorismate/anthranilate synthase component II [Flavobacteriales bacterium]
MGTVSLFLHRPFRSSIFHSSVFSRATKGLRTLILDNYDSFTYNLVHYVEQFCDDVTVRRNDAITLAEVAAFDAIVLSPGPGLPKDAGIMPELIRHYAPTKRILGVCLGHQAISEAFGARLKNLDRVLHGVAIPIVVTDVHEPLFRGLPTRMDTGRYHSWVIDRATLPAELRMTAVDDAGEVMAIRHAVFDVCGVQFHPESLLTPQGLQMVRNWVAADISE